MNCINLEIESKRLEVIIKKNKKGYKNTNPFPNVVIDNFFSKTNLKYILEAFPKSRSTSWKKPENVHTRNKKVLKTPKNGLKEQTLNLRSKMIFYQLNSSIFLNFLEKLTGIEGLLPDPYLYESGFHSTGPGGYLNPHADFSHHDKLKLQRRLNFIFYLNKEWKSSYGGDLNLYNKDVISKKIITPKINRCIIFSTSDHSFHGHPTKITENAPFRNSLAMYYYTVPRDKKKHRVIYPLDKKFKWFSPSLRKRRA
jgi:Rps23 Pro-64 3,4-dihydroxylase Tpa1-like proline 4-hydroxylase